MQCPLCGFVFDESKMACHASCAFNKHCTILCCPNCGYRIVDVSKSSLAAKLRKAMEQLTGRQLAKERRL
jgi:rubredoxin